MRTKDASSDSDCARSANLRSAGGGGTGVEFAGTGQGTGAATRATCCCSSRKCGGEGDCGRARGAEPATAASRTVLILAVPGYIHLHLLTSYGDSVRGPGRAAAAMSLFLALLSSWLCGAAGGPRTRAGARQSVTGAGPPVGEEAGDSDIDINIWRSERTLPATSVRLPASSFPAYDARRPRARAWGRSPLGHLGRTRVLVLLPEVLPRRRVSSARALLSLRSLASATSHAEQ